jgi:hypothetical protein
MRGRAVPISLHRRWIHDLLHFSRFVPTVPVQKRMQIGDLIAARAALSDRPRWTAIFTKAYAHTAQSFPDLRRAYLTFPWPRLYEYPTSKACITVEREYQGESAILPYLVRDPASKSLWEISFGLNRAGVVPPEQITEFRRLICLTKLPRPLRRVLWWSALNIGRQRANYFGTFGLSVYSALQAESLHPLSFHTTTLNYGVFNPDGTVDVRIMYDHRVMNGATVARALNRLNEILNTDILEEIRSGISTK